MSPITPNRERRGQQGKMIEDVVPYAVGHRIRVEILMILNQGTYSASELADIIGQPLNKTAHHLKEMALAGSIEVASTKMERNFERHFYRANLPPHYPKEEWIELHEVERQMIVGFLLQALIAESLGALRAKKLAKDPDVVMLWDHVNVDEEGRRKITEAQERHFEHLEELEEEALLRAARTGEKTTSHMIASLSFERGLKAPVPRTSADAD